MSRSRRVWIIFWVLLVSLGCAYGFNQWLGMVEIYGINIPKINISDDYLTALFWAFGLGVSLVFWPLSKMEKLVMIILWAARCFTTLGFMLLYENFYIGLDSWGYLRSALGTDPFRTKTTGGTGHVNFVIQWMNENLPLFSSYHAMKVIFSMMGLIGVYMLYRAVSLAVGRRRMRVLLFLGLFPSILFWSSILGKDPIYFMGTAFFIYGMVAYYHGLRWRGLVSGAAGIFLCCFVRFWAAPLLICPIIAAELLLRWRPTFSVLVRTTVVFIVGFFVIRALSGKIDSLITNLIIQNLAELNRFAGVWGTGDTRGGSALDIVQFQGLGDVFLFLPIGMFTALFRPVLGEVNNMFGVLAGLENVFLLGFLFVSLRDIDYRKLGRGLLLGCFLIIITWSSAYAFVSSQNLGSGFRFRLQIIGFLFLLIFLLKNSDRNEVPKKPA